MAYQPIIQDRALVLPSDWTGPVRMLDLRGRARELVPMARNRYALPPDLPRGVYVFRAGACAFRASVL